MTALRLSMSEVEECRCPEEGVPMTAIVVLRVGENMFPWVA